MYYVNDDDHRARGGEGFEAALAGALAAVDGGTLYVEGLCLTAAEKARVEETFERFVAGEADLLDPAEMRAHLADEGVVAPGPKGAAAVADPAAWSADAWAVVHADGSGGFSLPKGREGSRHALLGALADHPGAVAEVDAGPVHGGLDRGKLRVAFRADRTSPAAWSRAEARAWVETITARDRNWAAHLAAAAGDGGLDDAVVVMGGHHRLDRYLDRGVALPDHGVAVPALDVRLGREDRSISPSFDPTDVGPSSLWGRLLASSRRLVPEGLRAALGRDDGDRERPSPGESGD